MTPKKKQKPVPMVYMVCIPFMYEIDAIRQAQVLNACDERGWAGPVEVRRLPRRGGK